MAAGFISVLADSDPVGSDPPASLDVGGRRVLLSHFPYAGGGDSHGPDRFARHHLADRGDWLLCGHLHQAWRQRGKMINVGVDAWSGAPVSAAELTELIQAGPKDTPALRWDLSR